VKAPVRMRYIDIRTKLPAQRLVSLDALRGFNFIWILGGDGAVIGRITLNGIVRGPFQSCSVGYWVSEAANGNGVATAALRHIMRIAFDEMGLHRIQAETRRHNIKSQRVLARNGFVQYGLAPTYLKIAGAWQDCLMFQAITPHDM